MKIIETDGKIHADINEALAEHFEEVKIASKIGIEARIRKLVIDAIKNEPEYHSLLNGRLLGEFGLTEANAKMESILDEWSRQIVITIDKKGMKIQAIYADFKDILDLPAAQQITNKGETLDWLDWLLVKGDKVIIRDYKIEIALGRKSRTGLAVMVKEKRAKWKVPSQYSGTVRKNWITRAIDNIPESSIETVVLEEISKQW